MILSTLASVVMAVLPSLRRPAAPITTGLSGGTLGQPATTYQAASRAYSSNEIVYAAVNQLASSASEPHIIGRRYRRARAQIRNQAQIWKAMGIRNRANAMLLDAMLIKNGFVEDLPDHPLVRLLNNPNPFTSRGLFWSTAVMDYFLAGNWFALKSRYQSGILEGVVAELWRLRPDRVRVIPGDMSKGEPFIKGYEYRVNGGEVVTYAAEDIIHIRTRNPQDLYYGQPPIMPIMPWVSIDEYMRRFLTDFFQKGGTGPGAILTVKETMEQADKDRLRDRFRAQFGAPGSWFELLILDQTESSYTQLGLNRGLRDALPKDISDMVASRIIVDFNIPADVIGLDSQNTSYASRKVSWQIFWDMTITPLLSDFADGLNLSIKPDFGGIDEVLFDLSDIRALAEANDAIHERVRRDWLAGLLGRRRAMTLLGEDPEADPDDIVLIPATSLPTRIGSLGEPIALPQQQAALQTATAVALIERRVGRPRLEEDEGARAIWEEARQLREENPRASWAQIAEMVGAGERTLRNYRSRFEDEVNGFRVSVP